MAKYFDTIDEATHLDLKTGSTIVIPSEFQLLSSTILSQCVFLQNLIQQIIYTSHGTAIFGARRTLKDFPNPKARVDFLCSFDYDEQDPIVSKVFDFARMLFSEIYQIRNVLAHEVWYSGEEYPGSVLFSKLDENSRLLIAQGKIWHMDDTTPEEIHDATVRYIRKIKVVNCNHLKIANGDINLCSWSLMNINNILNEEDPQQREEARQAFCVYHGTSHLFDDVPQTSATVEYTASKKKSITGTS